MSTYRTTCPVCGNGNYVVWLEEGRGTYCYNCSHSERRADVPVKAVTRSKNISLIREFYAETSEYYHKQLRDQDYLFLLRRGISEYSIKFLKIGYCPDEYMPLYASRTAAEAGIYYNGHISHKGRITFPFFAENDVTDIWSRSISPEDTVKYKGCFSSAYRRGADYAYMHDYAYKPNAYKQLIRTEGIIKAIIANQYGFPTIAYPGTLAYRSGTPPMVGQTQIIIFDNQKNHRRELIAAIKREADRYTKPKIGVLPLLDKDKQDCDSYILEYGTEAFKRVIDGALEYSVWKSLVR